MPNFEFKVDNIHCVSCKQAIENELEKLEPKPLNIHISIAENTVIVNVEEDLLPSVIAKRLMDLGFEVVSIDSTNFGEDNGPWLFQRVRSWKRSRAHKRICKQCNESNQSHDLEKGISGTSDTTGGARESSASTVVNDGEDPNNTEQEYRAVYSIGGMTCASCVGTIESSFDDVDFKCDLINHSGSVVIKDKRQSNEIQEKIRDIGYDCDLVELLPVSSKKSWRVVASIGGMTCASCTSTIKELVKEQDYVQEVNISLLTNSGEFFISDVNRTSDLKDIVEDAGYEYSQIEVHETRQMQLDIKSRTINLAVEGMFCE